MDIHGSRELKVARGPFVSARQRILILNTELAKPA